eukprot:3840005-Rhodomonas_salina.5
MQSQSAGRRLCCVGHGPDDCDPSQLEPPHVVSSQREGARLRKAAVAAAEKLLGKREEQCSGAGGQQEAISERKV